MVDQPDGWESINQTIKRDALSGGLYYESDMSLTTFGGQDLFIALKNLWETDPFGRSNFDVYQVTNALGYTLIHSGVIFHSDLKLELVNNAIQVKVEDDNWYSKIKANQSLEVSMGSTLSKNQIAINPAVAFDLEMHKVSNGTYYADKRKAFKVYDCLKFLISFMSDDEVGFESDCFNTGGVYSEYCLLIGHEVLYHDHTILPRISFRNLFEDLKKKFNLRFAIIYNGAIPVIKIEPADYFFDNTVSYTVPTVPDQVNINVDASLIWSRARVGSEQFDTTSSLIFPDVQSLITFREETVHFEGVNNTDNELDLVVKFITSNAILNICLELLSGADSYDENVFIVWYNPTTNKTYSTDWPNTGHHLYNEPLNNINTLQRWAGYIPGNVISNFNNTVSSRFKAVKTVGTSFNNLTAGIYGPVGFNDDFTLGYDPTGAYGGTTPQGSSVPPIQSIYTALTSGNYTVTSDLQLRVIFGTLVYQLPISIYFKKFDSGNNEIDSYEGNSVRAVPFQYLQIGPGGTHTLITTNRDTNISSSWNTYLNAGEYIAVYVKFGASTIRCGAIGGYFTSNGANNGNGVVLASNPNNYKCYKVNLKYPIKLTDFKAIGNSKNGLISIPLHNNRSIKGWVDNIKFDNSSGETSYTLISDGNTIYS